ncbi:hypothetical protein SAMN04488483_0585 [Pseudomonas helmanticensis]|uniref:Uncharacterized protein n=1 Tax=Pseudomonas helmanticensis TaxID=1471381 RepID=A0ACD2U0A5_9PSED|nr:hypothetical protein [Pseudomonas helmanticensis]SMQ22812.1 hypothetical protein SAMN04488483_0585 [Pseudomonas helmanticensis]
MKKIGNIHGTVFHKHFSDDAFKKSMQQKKLRNSYISTYCSAGGLFRTYIFLNQHFIKKSDRAKIIIGISDIDSDMLIDGIIFIIDRMKTTTEVYIHSACHVKMLSHDDLTILGSQNLSYGSLSYTKNLKRNAGHYRLHEALVEFEDTHQECAIRLTDELLSDPAFFLKLSKDEKDKKSIERSVERLRWDHDLQRSKEHRELAEKIKNHVKTSEALISEIKLSVLLQDTEALFTTLKNMYKKRSSSYLLELLEVLYSHDPFSAVFTNETYETLFITEALASEVDSAYFSELESFTALYEHILEAPDSLLEFSRNESLFDDIDAIIDRYRLLTPDEYINELEHDDINAEMESPDYSRDYTMLARDNDGNFHDSVFRSKRDKELGPRGKLKASNPKHLIHDLNERFEAYAREYLNEQYRQLLTHLMSAYYGLKSAYFRDEDN